jgi:ubiquitin
MFFELPIFNKKHFNRLSLGVDMNKVFVGIVFSLLFIGITVSFQAYGLQQVAGKIEANVLAGQSSTFTWGLISDNPDKVISVDLRAEGEGSQFLSFPKSVQLNPQQIEYVEFTVSVPSDYLGKATLNPTIYAVEKGQTGGPTVINIQMKKIVSLTIEGAKEATEQAKEVEEQSVTSQQQEPIITTTQEEPKSAEMAAEPICGLGTMLKDGQCVPAPKQTTAEKSSGSGGCLIATAAFGTELAPQVQLLREIRDNTLFGTGSGTTFMSSFNGIYYSFSPTVADWERDSPVFKEIVKAAITPMLSTLSILNYVDIDSEQEVLGYGIGIILLNIGMYFVAPAMILLKIKKLSLQSIR